MNKELSLSQLSVEIETVYNELRLERELYRKKEAK